MFGIFYTCLSDENGTARLNIDLEPGTYDITVQNPYDGLLESFNITVLSYSVLKNSSFNGVLINTTYKLSLVDDNGAGID